MLDEGNQIHATMATMEELQRRLEIADSALTIQGSDGNQRSLTQSFIDLESWAIPLRSRAPPTTEMMETLIDAKIRTAIQTMRPADKPFSGSKPILESKAIQDIGKLNDAKSYRPWSKKMKNALEQTRVQSRGMLEAVEKLTEPEIIELHSNDDYQSYGEAIIDKMLEKSSVAPSERDTWSAIASELNRDMWAILCAKAEAEAEENMDACNQGEGLSAYLRIHLWFTRTTAQGRILRQAGIINPPRCKHEHEISAAIENGRSNIEPCRTMIESWNCLTRGR